MFPISKFIFHPPKIFPTPGEKYPSYLHFKVPKVNMSETSTKHPPRLKICNAKAWNVTTDKGIESGKGLYRLSIKRAIWGEFFSVIFTNILNFPYHKFHNERVVFGSLGRPIRQLKIIPALDEVSKYKWKHPLIRWL